MWIGDSGATVHITNDDAEMFNIKKCDYDITVGNQETTKCTKMGLSTMDGPIWQEKLNV